MIPNLLHTKLGVFKQAGALTNHNIPSQDNIGNDNVSDNYSGNSNEAQKNLSPNLSRKEDDLEKISTSARKLQVKLVLNYTGKGFFR